VARGLHVVRACFKILQQKRIASVTVTAARRDSHHVLVTWHKKTKNSYILYKHAALSITEVISAGDLYCCLVQCESSASLTKAPLHKVTAAPAM